MKHGEYWKKRFSAMESEQYQKDEVIAQDIKRQFQLASDNIQGDIEKWYYRLAENNDITYTEAKKLLKADELEEFHWSIEEYIKKGEENAVNQKWIKELENASAKVHINRLQAINLQIQQEAEILHAKYNNSLAKHLKNSYIERFSHTAYEIARGTGVGYNLTRIDSRKIEQILKKPWAQDGANFSDRIWNNKEKLINTLHTELAQHVIRGTDPYNAVQAISKKMDVNKNRASTLVYTESAAIAAAAQKECFKELDVEKFEIVATLDSLTSEICREMDGKHFPMKEYEVGITAPPFHPNCRSVTCPYFEDDYGVPGKRAARGEDGKTYYVPADMTYKEWQQSFAAGGDKSGLQKAKSNISISPIDITDEWTKRKGIKGNVVEKQEFTIAEATYEVDGKHVVLRPTKQEKAVAVMLSEKYGKAVEYVPQVLYPHGIQTPDYLIDGRRFDLKTLTGEGKNLFYNAIAKKKKQSPNFIIDITNCPLSEKEIEKQIKDIFSSNHTRFVERIVLINNDEIIKVYRR